MVRFSSVKAKMTGTGTIGTIRMKQMKNFVTMTMESTMAGIDMIIKSIISAKKNEYIVTRKISQGLLIKISAKNIISNISARDYEVARDGSA